MKTLLALILLVTACEMVDVGKKPYPTPEPTPEPISPFIMHDVVPLGGPLTVFLCQPYEYNVEVLIDGKTSLGQMGKDSATDCMKLYYPSLNLAGKRTVTVKEYSKTINVVDF